MRIFHSSLLRAFTAIVIGALLLKYREDTVTWITILIGVLFLLSGIISVVTYYSALKRSSDLEVYDAQGNRIAGGTPTFPLVGAGSVILGLILALTPHMFINTLMYILAAMLILGAINQYASLAAVNRYERIAWGYWICPSLVLLAGAITILRPMWVASAPLVVIGVFMMLYGIIECVNAWKIHTVRKLADQQQHSGEQTAHTTAATEEDTKPLEAPSHDDDSGSFGI